MKWTKISKNQIQHYNKIGMNISFLGPATKLAEAAISKGFRIEIANSSNQIGQDRKFDNLKD